MLKRPAIERFWEKVMPIPESGCLIWMGSLNHAGYGHFRTFDAEGNPFSSTAHVFAFKTFVGSVPDGMEVDHKCGTRSCANPRHLQALTHLQNMRRSRAVKRTDHACGNGHPLTPENVYERRPGVVRCRICERERERRRARRTRRRNHAFGR